MDAALSAIIQVASAAAQGAGNASQAVRTPTAPSARPTALSGLYCGATSGHTARNVLPPDWGHRVHADEPWTQHRIPYSRVSQRDFDSRACMKRTVLRIDLCFSTKRLVLLHGCSSWAECWSSLQVMSAMMLAMVASAVVSTVSMSAVMVQRAQEAATPSPAAALAALIATPSPTPRCSPQRLSKAYATVPVQWLRANSTSSSSSPQPTSMLPFTQLIVPSPCACAR